MSRPGFAYEPIKKQTRAEKQWGDVDDRLLAISEGFRSIPGANSDMMGWFGENNTLSALYDFATGSDTGGSIGNFFEKQKESANRAYMSNPKYEPKTMEEAVGFYGTQLLNPLEFLGMKGGPQVGKALSKSSSKISDMISPEVAFDPSKRDSLKKLGGGAAALTAAAATPPLAKGIMSMASEAAPAASAAANLFTNSATPKLGYLLLNTSNPALMLKALKEGGPSALTKKLDEVDGIKMELPGYDEFADKVRFDEIEQFIKDPEIMRMKYKDKSEMFDGYVDDDFMRELLFDSDESFEASDYAAAYAEQGFDPVDAIASLEKYADKVPSFANTSKFSKQYPGEFRTNITENIYQSSMGGVRKNPGDEHFTDAMFLEDNYW